jgi:hypothetical protein
VPSSANTRAAPSILATLAPRSSIRKADGEYAFIGIADLTAVLDLRFLEFEDLELARDASDRSVWETCHAAGAIFITANRAGCLAWRPGRSPRRTGAGLSLLGLVAVTGMAATSVTGERERGTWTSLAMTLVDGREVVRAKVAGALWAVRGLLGLWGTRVLVVPGFIRVYLVGLALHALAAGAAMRAAAWAFHARRRSDR